MTPRILLVDDEEGLLEMIRLLLEREGYSRIDTATKGQQARDLIDQNDYDLIVLDVMLPDGSGFDLCQEIRKTSKVPILFLTSRTADMDILVGFGYGGDDYVTKPFHALELVARIKALLRRHRYFQEQLAQQQPEVLDYGDFQVIRSAGELQVKGKPVDCSAREFQLLLFFCDHPHHIFNVSELYEKVWKQEAIGEEKTVVMHISRLRKKIEQNPKQPRFLINVRGLGYKFVPPRKEGMR
ncbi:response regulator transcription factor [Kroppenstedtia eburnea]|uniref:DNA-binding response regulator, OmpR family, contains REC and winged-helix (WHTH) domain n=1 Tax=Kroppenstedtia eburnea TaxID=714067 RepID=A0A1N7MJ31_9BACL|nr:response regulator transcription factor [Kroppenstedtia eburnea]SIS86135.1 DNA-binding response regulator, OmpR family, contains REC and winged-helix (wHTH) domain [Kroppenstedtia eburnea]